MTIARLIAPQLTAEADASRSVAGSFSASDLTWERCQEQAALAFRTGDAATAARLWDRALAIARHHFGRGDPRLAASLTNQALVMRRRRQDYQAKRLFEDAMVVWSETWRWIHLMTPPPADPTQRPDRRGDLLTIYDPAARAAFTALAERGEAATARLERRDDLPEGGLAEWFDLKPRRMTDLRKLLAAILLIAPKSI